MTNLRSSINAESTGKIPQVFTALDGDLLILRPRASSPDEISKLDGIQAKLNMFKAFTMNSGKWTWNSNLEIGTTHTPPPPPAPPTATYACGGLPDVSTCTQEAASSEISSAQTTTPSVSSTAPGCPPGQTMSCGQFGMGARAFSSCTCVQVRESTSATSTASETTQPISVTPSSCPPHHILTCGQVGMGEHAFSSCACVQPRESTSVISTTPGTPPPIITTASTPETTTTATSTCPLGRTRSCMSKEGYADCICVNGKALRRFVSATANGSVDYTNAAATFTNAAAVARIGDDRDA